MSQAQIGLLVIGGLLVVSFIAGIGESERNLKEAENKPLINTRNWEQHQRRLNKFGESKYKETMFYVGPKGGVYYTTYRGTKVYC
tara:strand:- start:175 stop:429 length:255 start_codon:yes stop_codon:yes gene_type:complete